jgi:hypothetical protein
MAFIEDQQIALRTQGFTVLVKLLVAGNQKAIFVFDKHSEHLSDLFRGSKCYQRVQLASHPFETLSFPNLDESQRTNYHYFVHYLLDQQASNECQSL